MHEVSTRSHYDVPIKLDQCKKCGGVWFDNSELYRTKYGASKILDNIDIEKLRGFSSLEPKLLCPRDDTPLKIFKDPNFPKNIKVESCSTCAGFWFNYGEFDKFQWWRKKKAVINKKEKTPIDSKTQQYIDALMSAHSNKEKYESFGKLSKFLTTPVGGYSSLSRSSQKNQYEKTTLAIQVIRILMRMLLKV